MDAKIQKHIHFSKLTQFICIKLQHSNHKRIFTAEKLVKCFTNSVFYPIFALALGVVLRQLLILTTNSIFSMTYDEILTRECILQIIRTRTAFRQALQRMLRDTGAGITFEMLQILSCLWKEQGISQQKLAERTSKDKACLTNLMTNLERKGYVCRRESATDRRNKLVYLTPEGETFRAWIAPHLEDFYAGIERQVGRKNLQNLMKQLKELQDVFETY